MQRALRIAAALMALSLAPGAAWPQTYPTGPVTFIVSFPAGGSIDVVMRVLAPKLRERLGKPIVIENRTGAGGSIAAAAVAKATPDGLTLLAPSNSLASNPALSKHLPFDTLKDFQAIALIFRTPYALVVNPSFPANSVADLIKLAKEKPGQINYAHSGAGAALHLSMDLFQNMTGIALNGVAYRGAPPALNDVIAGHVTTMFADAGSVVPMIKAGKVRALAVSSLTRVPALPEVPTIAESGVPGFESIGWTLIFAPSATPKPIVDRLHAELKAVAAMPEVKALIERIGNIPVDSPPPAELQKFLASEIDLWSRIIERAGLAKSQ